MKSIFFKYILPLLIVAAGVGAMKFLKTQAKEADYTAPKKRVAAVETTKVHLSTMPTRVLAEGTVRAAKQVLVTPEVTGKIAYISDQLVPGRRIKKGDIIAKIDKRDFALALSQQQGLVEQAELNLTLEQSRGEVAKAEWSLLGSEQVSGNQAELALRKPQLQEARVRRESAKSGLKRAALALKKTIIRAPFEAIVIARNVDIGQVVSPQTVIATLMGSDELWVDVSTPLELLRSIHIPGLNAEDGSKATVIQHLGSETIKRTGAVKSLHGQLDSRNRTATVLVSIPNPFTMNEDDLPLLSGAFVDVEIIGDPLENVARLPRKALRDGRFVWIVDKSDKLKKKTVRVAWRERDNIMLTGLSDGDEVVTSPLAFPLEGMPVQRRN